MQIRLQHSATGLFLASVPKPYIHKGSSFQQIVGATLAQNPDTVWLVKGSNAATSHDLEGKPVLEGATIRLEHLETRRNLHSHSIPSPLTGQQEVTAFGTNGLGDENDDWILDLRGETFWKPQMVICLKHKLTGINLHSHGGFVHAVATAGLQEVTACPGNDSNDYWICSAISYQTTASAMETRKHPLDWMTVLNVISAVASITGWTLLSLSTTFQRGKHEIVALIAAFVSSLFVGGIFLLSANIFLQLYQTFTFKPKTTTSQIGFWLIVSSVLLVVALLAIPLFNKIIIPAVSYYLIEVILP